MHAAEHRGHAACTVCLVHMNEHLSNGQRRRERDSDGAATATDNGHKALCPLSSAAEAARKLDLHRSFSMHLEV